MTNLFKKQLSTSDGGNDMLTELKKLHEQQYGKNLFTYIGFLPYIGLVIIFVVAFNYLGKANNTIDYFSTVGYGALVGMAAYILGGFIGFLFGLPRSLSNPEIKDKFSYTRNDNLIQVSDWLTKIIVGLGLTNLYKIPELLAVLGLSLQILFGNNLKGSITAQAICVFYLISGFLYGYLWTNIKYIPILLEVDIVDELRKISFEKVKSYLSFFTAEKEGRVQHTKELSNTQLEEIKAKFNNAGVEFVANDPNKNQFGGKAAMNDRVITAKVSELGFKDGIYNIDLVVKSTNAAKPIVNGVMFHLHPTFSMPIQRIMPNKEGEATLLLYSYGSFTVGVTIEGEETQLELDLAQVPGVSQHFINT